MSFTFRLLGPVELLRSGRPVHLGPAKRRSMLAALALHANQPITLATLTELMWVGSPPASAVANLRTYAAGLRHALGDRLLSCPRGYQLHVDDGELDADEFITLAATGRQSLAAGDTPDAKANLWAALNLWRGPAGDGLEPGTTLHTRLVVLDQQRLDVFEDYVEAAMNNGHDPRLATQLREHLTGQPLRERAWAQLMLVLYRGGDVAGALAAYREARHTLRHHLGIDPGRNLTHLHHAILRREPALDAPQPPNPAPRRAGRILLPAGRTEIPDSLRAFAEEAHLPEADVQMLSAIHVRGQPPRTPERWRYIYTAIRTSEAIDG